MGKSIGEIKGITEPISYSLVGVRSNEIVKRNFLLLGNAAITLNPITAQGFNLSIKDVNKVCFIVKKSIIDTRLKICYKDLLYYQLVRNHEHETVYKNINIIFHFFKFNYFIPSYFRRFIFILFNNSSYFKKKFILYSQGVLIE